MSLRRHDTQHNMTISIVAFSIMTLSIAAFSIMTFSIAAFSIMTLSIMTLSTNDTQFDDIIVP